MQTEMKPSNLPTCASRVERPERHELRRRVRGVLAVPRQESDNCDGGRGDRPVEHGVVGAAGVLALRPRAHVQDEEVSVGRHSVGWEDGKGP